MFYQIIIETAIETVAFLYYFVALMLLIKKNAVPGIYKSSATANINPVKHT